MKKTPSEVTIHGLFPIPVLVTNLGRDFTKKELKFFEESAKFTTKNTGNLTGANRYVLDDPAMKDLKEQMLFCVHDFMNRVYAPRYPVEAYLTQTWLNYTKTGEYHHKHAHPNSWISGCLYVNADREKDRITFFKDGYSRIQIPTENYNAFNSESWWFAVGTGDIILFPSYLTHMVEQTVSTDTRVSIAINTFLKGYIGDEHSLTGLHLQGQDTDAPQRTEAKPENQQDGY